jgi:IS4 transposase
MQFVPSSFHQLVKVIDKRAFAASVSRHGSDAYYKSFHSWDHLIALIYGQLSQSTSLRALAAGFNAQSQHHYHLGCGPLQRSTLSDANQTRPWQPFAETFGQLLGQLDRKIRQEGDEMIRLIDSTPIPLGKLFNWSLSNGRIKGMKVHVIYDPQSDCPAILDITHANVNDVEIGQQVKLQAGVTYVFDKGYCHYGWWTQIAQAQAIFVTRPKTNMGLAVVEHRHLEETEGDGFTVLDDAEVKLTSKTHVKLPIRLRRITLLRKQSGDKITLISNDMTRSPCQIAALYKGRWQIELLFRWIKQHLKIKKFLGRNPNAIKLQLYVAMIVFALLRIVRQLYRVDLSILRFTDIVVQCLFERRHMSAIQKPPIQRPPIPRVCPNQLRLEFL